MDTNLFYLIKLFAKNENAHLIPSITQFKNTTTIGLNKKF